MEFDEIVLRILLAFLCGCIIGTERQIHHRTAGLKTNTLVALGACAFTIFDMLNYFNFGSDLRVSAQIVSGVGFLGGGVILKDGFNIKGLTTAATLWCSAAAGMLAGGGYVWEAALISILIMLVNTILKPFVDLLNGVNYENDEYLIRVTCDAGHEAKVKSVVLRYLEKRKLLLKDIKITKGVLNKHDSSLEAVILAHKNKNIEDLSHKIAENANINSIMWEILRG